MNKKEQIPLRVHKAIEPYLDKKDKLFRKTDSEDELMHFKGSSIDSNFFFHIKSHRKNNNGKNQIYLSYQPYNEESVEPRLVWVDCSSINAHFQVWYKLLSGFNNTKTIFDDPIINEFKEEYFSYFEIIDEDKDKPLSQTAIIPVYEHFEDVKERLNKYKNKKNTSEIEEIQKDIEYLNDNLTNTGRQEIANRICTIWAKLTKQGVKFIKEFVEVSRKHIMKEGAKRIFQLGQKGFEYIEEIEKIIN